MTTRPALLLSALLGTTVLLSACGPTATGLKAREDAAARIDAFNTQVVYTEARQAFQAGRLERAEKLIGEAIARYDGSPDYYLLQGRIYLELHQLEKAHLALTTAIEKGEAATLPNAEPHYFLGILYQRWSDFEQAYESYAKAAEIDTADVQYILAAAESLLALDRLDDARLLLEPKLTFFEHNSSMHQLLGQIAMLQSDPATAARHYEQAQQLSPDDNTVLNELARARFAAGLYQECLASVQHLQRQSEEDQSSTRLLEGRCLALLGRTNEARNVYQRLVQTDPTNADAWIELGTVAWELNDSARVAQCGLRVTTLAPQRFEGYMLKGIAEQSRGNPEGAIGLFRKAAEQAPNSALPRLLLGMAHRELGEHELAISMCRAALQLEPDNAEAAALLSMLEAGGAITVVPAGQ